MPVDCDGDLDLLCGEFLDGFTFFENTGSWTNPQYAAGRRLTSGGRQIVVELEMPVPHAIDWDDDGDVDVIDGDEDGRVALIEHTGRVVDEMPQFLPPRYLPPRGGGGEVWRARDAVRLRLGGRWRH